MATLTAIQPNRHTKCLSHLTSSVFSNVKEEAAERVVHFIMALKQLTDELAEKVEMAYTVTLKELLVAKIILKFIAFVLAV